MEEKRNAYRNFVGKPEGKKLIGRPRRLGMILKWILQISGGMGWIDLVWDRDHWGLL
jgi:hypothetical protein